MLAGRSVHGFGLEAPLDVVGVDRDGVVVGRAVLEGNQIVTMRRARVMIEAPRGTVGVALPAVGDVLRCRVGRVPG